MLAVIKPIANTYNGKLAKNYGVFFFKLVSGRYAVGFGRAIEYIVYNIQVWYSFTEV
jgi:hypothetical protein